MFAIYTKNVGGRVNDRYFISHENAKRELLKDVEDLKNDCGGAILRKIDRMNTSKGFYEFEYRMVLENGERATLAIIDGYFEDGGN